MENILIHEGNSLSADIATHAVRLGFRVSYDVKTLEPILAEHRKQTEVFFYFYDLPAFLVVKVKGSSVRQKLTPKQFLSIRNIYLTQSLKIEEGDKHV